MIGSSAIGAAADTAVVLAIAFAGIYGAAALLRMGVAVWALKLAWEVAAPPLSLPAIRRLKRAEGRDAFDRGTDFNPFALR